MRRFFVKFFSLLTAITLVMPLSGCLEEFDFTEDYGAKDSTTAALSSQTTAYIRTNFDISENPYYAMLSENEKNAYSQIFEELFAGNSQFECKVSVSADEISKAIDAVLYDHPELFWLDNTYSYTYDPETGDIRELTFDFFDFADTPEKLEAAKTQFNAVADSIVVQALQYSTTVERELFIHDYICENTEYDASGPYNQSAYSVLVLHESVCAGYTRAFQYLMQRLGVTCYYVTGRTDGMGGSDSDGSHSWNMVAIDGEFYNIDCLWDDTASEAYGSMIYPFFNVTDEGLVYHARIEMAYYLPSCTATEYKYSNQFGDTIEADSIVFEDAA